ncbi:MAG TPA: hypothetical protein VF796_26620, partial [Humisphaera sp.]
MSRRSFVGSSRAPGFRGLVARPSEARPSKPPRTPAVSKAARAAVERLEERWVLATINVAAADTAALIAAINSANTLPGADTISLAAGSTYTLTAQDNYWYGPNGLPAITSDVTIEGNGATIERSAAANTPKFRLFYVAGDNTVSPTLSPGTLTLKNLTLQGGLAKGGDGGDGGGGGLGAGGAIFNQGTTTLDGVLALNNTARGGAAVNYAASQSGGGGGIGGDGGGITGIGGGGGGGGGMGGNGGNAGYARGGGGGGGYAGNGGSGSDAATGGGGGGGRTGNGGNVTSNAG